MKFFNISIFSIDRDVNRSERERRVSTLQRISRIFSKESNMKFFNISIFSIDRDVNRSELESKSGGGREGVFYCKRYFETADLI